MKFCIMVVHYLTYDISNDAKLNRSKNFYSVKKYNQRESEMGTLIMAVC